MKPLLQLIFFIFLAGAQTPLLANDAPLSLDDLLRTIAQASQEDSAANRARLARFRAEHSKQAARLDELKNELEAARGRSKQLEQAFDANNDLLEQKREALDLAQGDMQELYGVLEQAGAQARARFQDSPTQVQFAGRTEFLDDFLQRLQQSSRLPAIGDIRQLWFEIQRDIVASGRVASFEAPVVQLDGSQETQTVMRAGVFNVFSAGAYLQYLPATGQLNALPRQPGSEYPRLGGAEMNGDQPLVAALDPARGQLLEVLLQAPGWRDRLHQGGVVGYIILALGALALVVALERLVVLGVLGARVGRQARMPTTPGNNPLGRILAVAVRHRGQAPEVLEAAMEEALLKERPKIQRGLGFIKITAAVAPLLGLLGTVVGMILTFQAITLFGNSDPKMMAGGISQALVTTVLGLSVAIPILLVHTLVAAKSRSLWQVLAEQATGIVAESLLAAAPVQAADPETQTPSGIEAGRASRPREYEHG
ncbi:MAG: MotA/TolQ/ExbB proton channel family protein [Pseudomonadales bacterium]|nr:MotA/TolQ/ExbB proton channel family protein [Pseudomonadales bacterium]